MFSDILGIADSSESDTGKYNHGFGLKLKLNESQVRKH